MRLDARSIDSSAVEWAVKLDRGLSEAERQELDRWLVQDPRCLGALARVQAIWVHAERAQVLKGADRLVIGAPWYRLAPPRRRWALAAAIAMSLLGAKLWLDFAAEHPSTAVGEIRQIPLEDGSRVTLDTGSRVDVQYKAQTRLITLERGGALFDVAKDPLRPFVVKAGHTRIRAVGTSFVVRRSDKGEEVIVIHGAVDVWRELDAPEPSIRLPAQHRSLAYDREPSSPELLSPADMERATAWESGVIALSGQTLAEASQEFNRYNRRQHISVNPALAGETVVGRFQSADPAAFAQAAAAMLKARVRTDGDSLILEPISP